VIIESRRHIASASELDDEEIRLTCRAYRDRMQVASLTNGVAHAMLFKNVRPAAGASLEHAHSHLTGLPFVPALVDEELRGAHRYRQEQGRCVFCDLIHHEQQTGTRMLKQTPNYSAFCPFASRFAFETWILPLEHTSHFERLADGQLAELALLVRESVWRLERAAGQPAYNYVIHSAPFDMRSCDHYHWHMEILPRTANAGGFEWGTGSFINSVPPEQAALALREARSP
jgi:UDPglucose--hexose-1-phosphate uridylyltransferase